MLNHKKSKLEKSATVVSYQVHKTKVIIFRILLVSCGAALCVPDIPAEKPAKRCCPYHRKLEKLARTSFRCARVRFADQLLQRALDQKINATIFRLNIRPS